VGRRLCQALLDRLVDQGVHVAVVGITLPNPASVALTESLGFEPVGVYRRIGYKAGAWRDVGWWQRELLPAGDEGPDEPGPPAR
jgi:L-amino acid N-acyltransferase YncA